MRKSTPCRTHWPHGGQGIPIGLGTRESRSSLTVSGAPMTSSRCPSGRTERRVPCEGPGAAGATPGRGTGTPPRRQESGVRPVACKIQGLTMESAARRPPPAARGLRSAARPLGHIRRQIRSLWTGKPPPRGTARGACPTSGLRADRRSPPDSGRAARCPPSRRRTRRGWHRL